MCIAVLTKTAQSCRKWAETYAAKKEFPDDLTGVCAIAAGKLHTELLKAGIEAVIHMTLWDWKGHCFVVATVDDQKYIVDVTATQFTEHKTEPVLIKKYTKGVWPYAEAHSIARNARSLRNIQIAVSWARHQHALTRY